MAMPSKFRILCIEYTSKQTIFGWIVFIYNVISIIISIFVLIEADYLFKAAFANTQTKETSTNTWISLFFGTGATIYSKLFVKSFLVFKTCGLITSIALIVGLVKRKRNLLIPYMVYDFMGLTLWTIIWITTLLDYFEHMTRLKSNLKNIYWLHIHVPEIMIKTVGCAISAIIFFYCMLYYKELKKPTDILMMNQFDETQLRETDPPAMEQPPASHQESTITIRQQ